MDDFKIVGKIVSVAAIFGIYVLTWAIIHENWDEYGAKLYDSWCWEKLLGIFYRIWVYGHVVLIIGGLIAWFVWSWI